MNPSRGPGADALALLRRARRRERGRRRRDAAYRAYVVLLLLAVYVVPYAVIAADGADGEPAEPWAARLHGALPLAVTALALVCLRLVAGAARWRGPVVLDAATVTWLLPTPVDRSRLLGPRFRRTLLTHALAGAAAGFAGAWFARLAVVGGIGPGLLWAAVAGAAAGVFGAGAAGLLACRAEAARWPLWSGALTGGAALTAVCCVLRPGPGAVEAVLLWSGPWGWAGQVWSAACGVARPGWPVALVLLVGGAAAVAAWADRLLPGTPAEALRTRARTATAVSAALVTMDFRLARLTVRDAGASGTRRRRMLPAPRPPHDPRLVLPWRTLVHWLTRPAPTAWAAFWLALACAAVVADRATGTDRAAAVLGALAAAYGAAVALLEAARLDGDDPARSRSLPWPLPGVMLRHAALPTAALMAGGALAGAVAGAAGLPVLPVAVLTLCLPALVAAGLVSACRGTVPVTLLVGTETALGNTAPANIALWYLRAPAATALLLFPPVTWTLGARPDPLPAAGAVLWLLLTTAGMTAWAWFRAWSHQRG